MTDVEVSVVIPAKNATGTIGEQLEALAEQRTARSWEVIVADNDSTDGTADEARRYADMLPVLRVVDASGTASPGYARNVGAHHSRGAKLLFCDADDVVCDGWVDALAAGLDQYTAVGGTLDIEALNSPDSIALRPPMVTDHLHSVMGWPRAVSANCAVHKSAFEELGGFDTEIPASEDTELFIRLQLAGFTLGFAPDALVRYRHRVGVRANLRQTYLWHCTRPLLYQRFRQHGAKRRTAVYSFGGLVRDAWWLTVGRQRRLAWLGRAAQLWGRTVGSIRYRVWYI